MTASGLGGTLGDTQSTRQMMPHSLLMHIKTRFLVRSRPGALQNASRHTIEQSKQCCGRISQRRESPIRDVDSSGDHRIHQEQHSPTVATRCLVLAPANMGSSMLLHTVAWIVSLVPCKGSRRGPFFLRMCFKIGCIQLFMGKFALLPGPCYETSCLLATVCVDMGTLRQTFMGGEEMVTLDMHGPYHLTNEEIDKQVTRISPETLLFGLVRKTTVFMSVK